MRLVNREQLTRPQEEILLRIVDGYGPVAAEGAIVHKLLDFRRWELIMEWLIRHGLTGKTLEYWHRNIWQNEVVSMVKFILSKIDKAPQKPILYGDEYTPQC
jgi:hypothetical protein